MEEEIKKVLESVWKQNKVCSLATVNKDEPWVASAYFAEDGTNFYCLVTHGAKSLKNMQENPKVSFSMDDRQPVTFIQGVGTVEILSDEAREKGKDALLKKIPEIEPFMKEPHFEIVNIRSKTLFVTDFTQGWFPARTIEL